MKLITLYVPETYLRQLDQLVAERFYPNRAEAIRSGIRDLLVGHFKFTSPLLANYERPSPKRLAEAEQVGKPWDTYKTRSGGPLF